jgi:hypothetical protein
MKIMLKMKLICYFCVKEDKEDDGEPKISKRKLKKLNR